MVLAIRPISPRKDEAIELQVDFNSKKLDILPENDSDARTGAARRLLLLVAMEDDQVRKPGNGYRPYRSNRPYYGRSINRLRQPNSTTAMAGGLLVLAAQKASLSWT